MNETLKTEKNIREYLLGRITDDALLAEYEELLFADDEFCEIAEIAEDSLINDFVFDRLSEDAAADFIKTLSNNSDRRRKVHLTRELKEHVAEQTLVVAESRPSFFDSIKAFFRKPIYAGGFAFLLIAVLLGSFIIFRSPSDELANLKDIYRTERPVEPRIAGFDYAPLVVTRGAADDVNKNKLELERTRFLQAVVEDRTAVNFHKLGVFYLTQQNYKDAIENLEKAVKLDDKNAKFHNDLGSAYFESAKQSKDDKLLNLSRANESFAAALKLNGDSLEALFNRSLVLQEMGLRNQAAESWNLYLQKDSASKWADEARKNLEKIKQIESGSTKTKEQVLEDFLTAYRNQNWQFAEKIHNSTKGMLNGISPFEQLTRRYLDARKARDALITTESLDAMNYIGNLEREKHADFFYAEAADYYSNVDDADIDNLLQAKDLWTNGYRLIKSNAAAAIIKFEESEKLFVRSRNENEAKLAHLWSAQMLVYDGKLGESLRQMSLLLVDAKSKKFKTIEANLSYWIGICHARQRQSSQSNAYLKAAYVLSRESANEFEIKHSADSLAGAYRDLGELQKAIEFSSVAMGISESYYESPSQIWRNINTVSELIGYANNHSTSIDFALEGVRLGKIIFEDKPSTNESLSHLVNAHRRGRQFDLALEAANQSNAIAVRRETTPQNSKVTADSYLIRAELWREMEKCELALDDYQKALEHYASLSEVIYSQYSLHKGKLLCLQSLARQQDFDAELQTVLSISEEYRKSIREDDSRRTFFESEQIVFDAAVSNKLKLGDDKKAFEFAEMSRARSLLEFVKSDKSIAEVEQDFSTVSKSLDINEIQNRLPDNVQLVEYQLLDDRIAVWLITKTRFEVTTKQIDDDELNRLIADHRKSIIAKSEVAQTNEIAKQLYNILIPDNLESDKTLCVVPDKALHQVSFAALMSPADKYLIEDLEIIYSPSASIFVIASENARARKSNVENLLSVGNPAFDQSENPALKNLPDAELEAKKIAESYDKRNNFNGVEASKDKFLETIADSEVIHFAGHFVANPHSPANSKMLFADGDLRSFELADKKLPNSKLVVLSACETAFEQFNKSEGAIGIARTFLAMGTPLVVASSWKVDSEATKDLMIAFHNKRRVEKLSSAAALRQAQLMMLRSSNFSSPYYWSAFSATGGLTNY